MVEDRSSSHRLDDYWCLDWAVHPRQGNKWWSSRRSWRSTDMRGPLSCIEHMGRGIRCLRFHSNPERTWKWTVCLTLDFILCWWISIKYTSVWWRRIILLLNTLLWDVRAQRFTSPDIYIIFTYVVVRMQGVSDISVYTEPMDGSDRTEKRMFRNN